MIFHFFPFPFASAFDPGSAPSWVDRRLILGSIKAWSRRTYKVDPLPSDEDRHHRLQT